MAYLFGPPVEYLAPTYSTGTLTFILHTLGAKNLDSLELFNKILLLNTSSVFLNLCNFRNITVTQGSVATYLRCGGIYRDRFGANLCRVY